MAMTLPDMLFPDYRDAKITIKNFASCPGNSINELNSCRDARKFTGNLASCPVKVMSPCKGRDNFPIFKK